MRVSFIATVYNEAKTVQKLLDSLIFQTQKVDEVIIVDGGSIDETFEILKSYGSKFKKRGIRFNFSVKKGNRSIGRNEAINNSTGEIILSSDAGNILDKNWVKNITKPFMNRRVDVVAGFYAGKANNTFQKCLVPYALVMPDRVNSDDFLPATRSMAFKKSVWKKVGGFDRKYSHNEDYVFSNKLRNIGANIVLAKDAIVYWMPRKNLKRSFIMFFRFAFGDVESGIIRPKVLLLFARYFLAFYVLFLSILYHTLTGFLAIIFLCMMYLVFSIIKNYRYVKKRKAFLILPALQFTADLAVLSGTVLGLLKTIRKFQYLNYVKKNKSLLSIISIYILIELITLRWGIPNVNHPFPYNMDEWHQLNAVRATIGRGTPNIEGSAHGTLFHFLVTGFYLAPFTLFKFINPFVIRINDFVNRERIFELLRLNTVIYGVLATFFLYKVAKQLKVAVIPALLLFTFTPIWLLLSGYFKYDIALLFWIILSTYFILLQVKNPSVRNFLIAAIPSGLTVAVKISGLPILLIYASSFVFFGSSWKKNLKYLFLGIGISIFCIIIFGMPDVLFGKGNLYEYIYYNFFTGPALTSNIIIGTEPYFYLLIRHYPLIFGFGFVFAFFTSFFFFITFFLRNKLSRYKLQIFILFAFSVFMVSILSLGMYSAGNRSLVILPFATLLISFAYRKMKEGRFKLVVVLVFITVFFSQMYQSFAWLYIKIKPSPQEIASRWLVKNIPMGSEIGLENVPIYQYEPDIIQKEFYFKQYKIRNNNLYKYQIIDAKSQKIPNFIVLSNAESESKFLKETAKKPLLRALDKKNYKKVATFNPNLNFYYTLGNDQDYFLSGLIVSLPLTISVFEK